MPEQNKTILLMPEQNKSHVVDAGTKQGNIVDARTKQKPHCWCWNKTKVTLLMEHSKSNTTIICQICQQLVKGLCWRKLEIIWPDTRALPRRSLWFDQTASHSLSYSVSYLYRYRAARAKQIKLKKANVNSKQRESKIILNSKRHDKIREIFSLSSQKYLFHIHFTPPLCRFPTILWQSSREQWKNWVFLKLDENDSFLM